MSIRTMLMVLALILVLFILAGCAAGPNSVAKTPDANGRIAGFWLGLWHGFISPVTWFLSLFMKNIHFYDVHNNGGWYNFGFVVGAGIIFSGSERGRFHISRKCKRCEH
ncbi:MAG TPA: hypothetical protein PLE74_02535 [Candidatus Cloacimonadota bacterium]|nr:hypothetical protein [Candidatus Cloacimonadota bacterium]HPT71141.1 hypothetical protein [Candidatus Cloacimonadota bacterium]